MSAVAIPPPAAPVVAQPAPPPAQAPAPHVPVTEHNLEDRLTNRYAAKMAATQAAPAPAVAPPAATEAPKPVEGAPAASTATEIAVPAVQDEPNLEDLDFDAPIPVKEITTETPAGEDPALRESDNSVEGKLLELIRSGGTPDEIEKVFLRHSQGKKTLQARKMLSELSKPSDQGGIGRVPSIEEIKEADSAYREIGMIRHEITNAPDSFARNMFAIDPDSGRSWIGEPQQIHAVASQIPQVLLEGLRTNPQIYSPMVAAVSGPFFQQLLDHQYAIALSMPDEVQRVDQQGNAVMVENADKFRWLDAWRILETTVIGKPRPLPRSGNGGGRMNDPQADQELQALRQRNQQYERQFQDMQRQGYETRAGGVESSVKTGAMADIDKALDFRGVKAIYSDMVLEPQRQAIYNEIHQNLATSNPTGWNQYQIQLQQAARGQLSADQPTKTYSQLFRNALKSSDTVRQRLSELVQSGQRTSQEQIDRKAQTQLRSEPAGGQPAPASVLPAQQIVRQPGESQEDFYTRRYASRMTPR